MRVPGHLCWPVWRLYVEQGTDPAVIEKTWTLGLVIRANEALDIQDEANRRAIEAANKKKPTEGL